MATVKIKRLILTDFKGVRKGEYVFSNNTKISAANGLGKTTIATAWYWLTMDKDYEDVYKRQLLHFGHILVL